MADPRWNSPRIPSQALGLDLNRCVIGRNLGNYVANSAATFRQGQLVELNGSQECVIASGAVGPIGVAKFSRTAAQYASVVGEYIRMAAAPAQASLRHANVYDPSGGGAGGGTRVAAALTGAAYTEGVDYSVSYVNGTILNLGVGIPALAYVYVNYMYLMTTQELAFYGTNFWNSQDDVSVQDNQVTVINTPSVIFTTAYDPSITYTVNVALYVGVTASGTQGLFTTNAASGFRVGHVLQVPSAADPFLGVRYLGINLT